MVYTISQNNLKIREWCSVRQARVQIALHRASNCTADSFEDAFGSYCTMESILVCDSNGIVFGFGELFFNMVALMLLREIQEIIAI